MNRVEQLSDAAGPALYQGARPATGSESASPSSPAPLILSGLRADQRRGLSRLLGWLEQQPGDIWQDRWHASGADTEGNIGWRRLPADWLAVTAGRLTDTEQGRLALARGMSLLVCADVIRPSLGWLMTPATPRAIATEIAAARDPSGFANLAAASQRSGVSVHTTELALRRVASIVAAKGGMVADITVGDCLELLRIVDDQRVGRAASSPYFYQLLHAAGVFTDTAPAVRGLRTQGQLGCEQLIDRYRIACRPVRDLLVDYLRERQPGLDYASLHKLSYVLGRLFWRDLEIHHPGIASLHLPAAVAAAWKQRIAFKTVRTAIDGQPAAVSVPRVNAADHLMTVRAFYLDLSQWAADDPSRWGPWVVPCPIRDTDAAAQQKKRSHRKSRMDQRSGRSVGQGASPAVAEVAGVPVAAVAGDPQPSRTPLTAKRCSTAKPNGAARSPKRAHNCAKPCCPTADPLLARAVNDLHDEMDLRRLRAEAYRELSTGEPQLTSPDSMRSPPVDSLTRSHAAATSYSGTELAHRQEPPPCIRASPTA